MSKIYKIINNINNKVYIGKTEYSLQKRFTEHCKDSKKRESENRPLYNAMRKYGTEVFSIHLVEECSPELASIREQYWIAFYEGYEKGYNATLGGEGKLSIDRQEILNLWKEGKNITEIADVTHHDRGQIRLILQENGITESERAVRGIKKNSKAVKMLDKKTEQVIKVFYSTREAARYLIQTYNLNPLNEGSYSAHISEVCRGKRKTCQGYKWQYANS